MGWVQIWRNLEVRSALLIPPDIGKLSNQITTKHVLTTHIMLSQSFINPAYFLPNQPIFWQKLLITYHTLLYQSKIILLIVMVGCWEVWKPQQTKPNQTMQCHTKPYHTLLCQTDQTKPNHVTHPSSALLMVGSWRSRWEVRDPLHAPSPLLPEFTFYILPFFNSSFLTFQLFTFYFSLFIRSHCHLFSNN